MRRIYCHLGLFILILSLSGMIQRNVFAANLYAIVVGDMHDNMIGETVKQDLKNVNGLLTDICFYTDLEQVNYEISDGEEVLNRANILQIAESIDSTPDDVIFFYFAGHGIHESTKKDKWPDMIMSKTSLGEKEVFDVLSQKESRILFVIVDACNRILETETVAETFTREVSGESSLQAAKGPNNQLEKNFTELFIRYSGKMIVSSATVDEKAGGRKDIGGLFTHRLVHDIIYHTVTTSSFPNWENIQTAARETIDAGNFTQNPQFEIDPHKPSQCSDDVKNEIVTKENDAWSWCQQNEGEKAIIALKEIMKLCLEKCGDTEWGQKKRENLQKKYRNCSYPKF